MKKVETLSNDPWQKLAKSAPVKTVRLEEVLQRLEVPGREIPDVKKEMLNRVKKITKAQG